MNGDGVCQRGEERQARVWDSQESWFFFSQFISVAGERTSADASIDGRVRVRLFGF
jgi:hypothetical protein